jgi:hypothetical protein
VAERATMRVGLVATITEAPMYWTPEHIEARHLMAALGRGIPAARRYLEADRYAKAVITRQRARQECLFRRSWERTRTDIKEL